MTASQGEGLEECSFTHAREPRTPASGRVGRLMLRLGITPQNAVQPSTRAHADAE